MGQRLKGTTAIKNYQDLKKDFGKIPTKKKEISSYGVTQKNRFENFLTS